LALYEDKKGNIWVGTKQDICVYDGAKFVKIEGQATRNNTKNKHFYTKLVSELFWITKKLLTKFL